MATGAEKKKRHLLIIYANYHAGYQYM